MKIDLHSHFIPRDCIDITDRSGGRHGPTIGKDGLGQEVLIFEGISLGPVVAQVCDPERRIQDMNRIGLDMQALSLSPTNIFYNVGAEEGLKYCRRCNDAIAEVVTSYPDRFVGMATLPMQDVSKAVWELERAVVKLKLRAVEILTNINGKNLDEPEFWPLYQRAQELDVPIYVHPLNTAGADRMQKYFLINLIGNPLDTSVSIASFIFGGILEKFPRLRLLFSHAGGCAPFIVGRWEHAYQFVTECRSISRPPSHYFKLMYFDTIAHFGPALAYLINTVGADKVVLGSDYPFAMGDLDPITTVRNVAGISTASKKRILEQTSAALLRL